jgi:hypothetical protein
MTVMVHNNRIPFEVVENVTIYWQFFSDPITITPSGFDYYVPLQSFYYQIDSTDAVQQRTVRFRERNFDEGKLMGVDMNDPRQVLERVLSEYAMPGGKRLTSAKKDAYFYIDSGRQFFMLKSSEEGNLAIKELLVNYQGKPLLLPFPSHQQGNFWFSFLDSDRYNQMNLPSYDNLHPIVDEVLEGSTYLLIIEP